MESATIEMDTAVKEVESPNETAKARKAHWTVVQDEALCRAWCVRSEDAHIGSQTPFRLWDRIYAEYVLQLPGPPIRSVDSLICRWKAISRDVNSYMSIYQSVVENQPDSKSVDEIVYLVRSTFLDEIGHPFTLDHCYLILKDSPKWNKEFKRRASRKVNPQKKAKTSSEPPTNLDSDNINLPIVNHSQHTQHLEAVKKAKERTKGEIFGDSLALMEGYFARLERSVGDSPELAVEREFWDKELEIRRKEVKAKVKAITERKKARVAKVREVEAKILSTGTSTMSPEVKAIWESRCNAIMERWKVGNYDGEPIEIEEDDSSD